MTTSEAAVTVEQPRVPPPQAGILNRPPEHALVFALELTGTEPRAVVEQIRAIVEAELRSDLEDMTDAPEETPPAETGELGFMDGFDRNHLTVTVGFSSAGLTKFGLTAGEPNNAMPADLIDIPWDRLGDGAVLTRESGDMVIQVCADSVYLVEHVLRRLESDLADSVRVVWVHSGTQRYTTRAGRTAREEGRALIGSLDGTSNLIPRHDPEHKRLVFVNPEDDSYPPKQPPEGTSGYGQPAPPRSSPPIFASPRPVNRHGRAAGPTWWCGRVPIRSRTGTALPCVVSSRLLGGSRCPGWRWTSTTMPTRRIFRRGYPLVEAAGPDGLRRGLLFISFGRTLTTQFEFMTAAWIVNPDFPQPGTGVDALRAFEGDVLAGGYYCVPALANGRKPWSWTLPDTDALPT